MKNKAIITTNPKIVSGTPVFTDTRVPVQTLFDYLEGGESIDTFLKDFPSVSRTQIMQLLESIKQSYTSSHATL